MPDNRSVKTEIYDIEKIYGILKEILGEDNIQRDVPMSEHITFRTGGPADIMAVPSCEEDVRKTVSALRSENVPYYILGNGSNVLVRDGGFRGVIIHIGKALAEVRVEGDCVYAGAGAMLSAVANAAAAESLEGLEFASGIPGSAGGAVFMNAGAYDGEISMVIESADALMPDGNIITFKKEDLDLGYRHSIFMDNGAVILSAVFKLKKGDKDSILEKIKDLTQRRTSKQPLELPSAGSTFKRPEGYFAGKLIDDAGCRGLSLGAAQVSPKHAGFVVNNGGATASEILDLIHLVQMRVKETSGVDLETEMRIIGED